jgi:hypothetical protein
MDEARMLIFKEKSHKTKALSWDTLKALQGRHLLTQGVALGLTDESRTPSQPCKGVIH